MAGAAGLTAAWLLSRRYKVTLFEAAPRLGGHAHTVDVPSPRGPVGVDVGFIVYNETTYPTLTAMFGALGVATQPSDMSFSVSLDGGRLEYAGQDNLAALFAQRRNLVRPRFWGMLADLARFYRVASDQDPEALGDCTLGEYLERGRFGRAFRDEHVIPMAAAIWSGSAASMAEFPASTFLRFCQNHGLLRFADRPRWRTVTGGSRQYVDRIAAALGPGSVRCAEPVHAVARRGEGVALYLDGGNVESFDGAVLATHAPQALALLGPGATTTERAILGAFRTQENVGILHSDPALMPRRKAAWSSWNYMGEIAGTGDRRTSVTYWMNRLQGHDPALPLFVTLNPIAEPRADLVHGRFRYAHPQFDGAAVAAQRLLPEIQGTHHVWYCGAWQRYGFHEDAALSAVKVAASLGAAPLWDRPQYEPAAGRAA